MKNGENNPRDRDCDLENPDYIGDLSFLGVIPSIHSGQALSFSAKDPSLMEFTPHFYYGAGSFPTRLGIQEFCPPSSINISPYHLINHFGTAKRNL